MSLSFCSMRTSTFSSNRFARSELPPRTRFRATTRTSPGLPTWMFVSPETFRTRRRGIPSTAKTFSTVSSKLSPSPASSSIPTKAALTERADHRVKARSHGRVTHPQLALDVFEVPSGFDERLQELQLLRGELVETTERERPLDARAARGAFQTRDAERFGADRAFRDHRVRHEPKMLACLIKCQDKLSDM